MKSSSLLKLYHCGIKHPREYRDQLIHNWYPIEGAVTIDYRLATSTMRTLDKVIKDGELKYRGNLYSVVWLGHPTCLRKHNFIMISFRYSQLLDCGYALIKAYEPDQKFSYHLTLEDFN